MVIVDERMDRRRKLWMRDGKDGCEREEENKRIERMPYR